MELFYQLDIDKQIVLVFGLLYYGFIAINFIVLVVLFCSYKDFREYLNGESIINIIFAAMVFCGMSFIIYFIFYKKGKK
jgi:hypothetical protein